MTGQTVGASPAPVTQNTPQDTQKSEWTCVSWFNKISDAVASKTCCFFGRAVAAVVSIVAFIPSLAVDLGCAVKSLYDRKIAKPQTPIQNQMPAASGSQVHAAKIKSLQEQLAVKEQNGKENIFQIKEMNTRIAELEKANELNDRVIKNMEEYQLLKNNRIQQLEEERLKLNNELESINVQYAEYIEGKSIHDMEIKALQEEVVKVNDENAYLMKKMDNAVSLKAAAAELQAEVDQLEANINELRKRHGEEVAHLTGALQKERDANEEYKTQLQGDVA